MERVRRLTAQLAAAGPRMENPEDVWSSGDRLTDFFNALPRELPAAGEYDVSQHLYGPLRDADRYPRGWVDAFRDLNESMKLGRVHAKFAEWQREYGKSLSANICVPYLIFKRQDGDEGNRAPPVVTHEIIIGNPEDARRIARVHVKKQPNFNIFFYGSVISTTDNDYWRMQREQLIPGFLPLASLGQIFDVSADRAQFCAQRLRKLADEGNGEVDMNEFLLYETQAQLQLALFGESNEFMEATNEKFRHAMAGTYDPGFVRPFCNDLATRMDDPARSGPALPSQVKAGECPAPRGPLSAQLREMEGVHPRTREGNSLIFAFAGHDTTGHTMTWLLFELAKHPDVQQRLQREVDDFYAFLGDRKPVYNDLRRLPFMTRCIMETLRLWPAVANGTFREIQFDDYITGPDGAEVLLKKGTYVRIVNWSRHRNPELWGEDAEEFNPDREFREGEYWHGDPLRAYNPATDRFSPFTFPPRGCIGMNFAQMEMRLIIASILRDFSFDLTEDFRKDYDPSTYLGVNYATLGPAVSPKQELEEGMPGWSPKQRVPLGLFMRVTPREQQ